MVTPNQRQSSAPGSGAFDADELFALARLDIAKNDLAGALQKLKPLATGADAPTGVFSTCGLIYIRLELWDLAQAMFQKHLARFPGAPDESFLLGLAHSQAGRAAEAVKHWDDLLRREPNYVPALLYRGALRARQGQGATARQDLELLMRVTPVDDPHFKPAKDLLQYLDAAQRSPGAAGAPPVPDVPASLPRNPYGAGSQ